MKAPVHLAWFILMAALCAGSVAEFQSAKRKALLIETDRVPPRGAVTFTPGEVNAYAAEEARKEVPAGLRLPKLVLGSGRITGAASLITPSADAVSLAVSKPADCAD